MKRRRQTRVVSVGDVQVGGDNPIRIQSMTTTPTQDVQATVAQIQKLADTGCEIARVTVQGKKEAYACEAIKNALLQSGYTIPLVADIHFYPPAALIVADFVDKVRINPGNFVDKRATFRIIQYDQVTYARELERIEEALEPLITKCKARNISMRIGTNHGSLSDRIMNRYGDTPLGMVMSAFEFTEVCRKYDFHNLIYSMKASNTRVMIHAYRLLVAEMDKRGWDYPLHLGVTEAGEGEEGRIKSSVGTGSLLLEGIGDTIRVSLTEDPEYEIDPCKRLRDLAATYYESPSLPVFTETHRTLASVSQKYPTGFAVTETEGELKTPTETFAIEDLPEDVLWLKPENFQEQIEQQSAEPQCIIWQWETGEMLWGRALYEHICNKGWNTPIIHWVSYGDLPIVDIQIRAGAEIGALLCDGIGTGLCLSAEHASSELQELVLQILQASRRKMTKTEFISCPGCGRTLFDIQSVAKAIREKTDHLPHTTIAIMGCIVNGPGEMADADFGYVGSGTGKVDLYVGKERVKRQLPQEQALDALIALIKEEGRWINPSDPGVDSNVVFSSHR